MTNPLLDQITNADINEDKTLSPEELHALKDTANGLSKLDFFGFEDKARNVSARIADGFLNKVIFKKRVDERSGLWILNPPLQKKSPIFAMGKSNTTIMIKSLSAVSSLTVLMTFCSMLNRKKVRHF